MWFAFVRLLRALWAVLSHHGAAGRTSIPKSSLFVLTASSNSSCKGGCV